MTKRIDPAEFDRRIAIVRDVQELDDVGKPISNGEPESVCDAWAKFLPVSDGEKLTHKHVSELTARFTIRWSSAASGIKSSDKLKFDGKTFGIFGIKEISRRQYIEITAGAHEA